MISGLKLGFLSTKSLKTSIIVLYIYLRTKYKEKQKQFLLNEGARREQYSLVCPKRH